MSTWKVDYYQINVSVDGKGDAAIALKVNMTTTPGKVESAVLIDGGNGDETADLILKTLQDIEKEYGELVKLDAISLSHWDQDHYKGIMSFVTKTTLWEKHKFHYFKYDDDDTPLTRFYCQAWGDTKYSANSKGKKASYLKKLYASSGVDTSQPPFMLDVQMQPKPEIRETHALMCYPGGETDWLLGCDIFTGDRLMSAKSAIESPKNLVDENSPGDGPPALYIVGYMLQFFPPQAVDVDEGLDVMAERQTPAPEATPTDGGQEGHRVVRIVDLPAKKGDKNQESIVLMLMWESPEAGEDPILSLYSGGDGEWTVEESVAAWARLPITVLKTGHHASLPSTSRAFIEIAKPEHILLSAGKEHNHPVQEWVLFFDAWFTSQGLTPSPRIHSVCYPYNLGHVEDNAYFQGKRFFVSEHFYPDTFADIATRPTESDKGKKWDFFDWLKTTNPGPLLDIRATLTKSEAWFTAPASSLWGWAYVKQEQEADVAKKRIELGSGPKNDDNPAFVIWDAVRKNYEAITNVKRTKKKVDYKTYFQTTCISQHVEKCWERWSSVSNSYYPSNEDKTGVVDKSMLVTMQYIRVQFFRSSDPIFSREPKDTNPNITGNPRAVKLRSVAPPPAPAPPPPAPAVAPRALTDPPPSNTDPPPPSNTDPPPPSASIQRQKRKMDDLRANITVLPSYLMSIDQETDIQSQELPFEEGDPAINDAASAPAPTPAPTPSPLPAAKGVPRSFAAALVTNFSYIITADLTATDSAVPISYDDTLANGNAFLMHMKDRKYTLEQSVPYTANGIDWNQKLAPSDSLLQWFTSFLNSLPPKTHNGPNAASEIQMDLFGQCLANSDSTRAVAPYGLRLGLKLGSSTNKLIYQTNTVVYGLNIDWSDPVRASLMGKAGFFHARVGCMFGLYNPDTSITFTLNEFCRLVGLDDAPFPLDGATQLKIHYTKGDLDPDSSTSALSFLPDPINAIWYFPANNNKTTIKLCAKTLNALPAGRLLGLDVDLSFLKFYNCSLIASKQSILTGAVDSSKAAKPMDEWIMSTGNLAIQCTAVLTGTANGTCQCWIGAGDSGLSLTLQWGKGQSPTLEDLLTWIVKETGIEFEFKDHKTTLEKFFTGIQLREVTIALSKPSGSWRLTPNFSFTVEANLGSSFGDKDHTTPLYLKFQYTPTFIGFKGGIWGSSVATSAVLDKFNDGAPFAPRLLPNADKCQYSIDLGSYFRGSGNAGALEHMPSVIPSVLSAFSFEISTDQVAFSGSLSQPPIVNFADDQTSDTKPPPLSSLPFLVFDDISLSAAMKNDGTVDFSFDALISLQARQPLDLCAHLEIDIDYSTSNGWTIAGTIDSLNVACLYSLIPSNDADAVMNVMQDLVIQDLAIEYNYVSKDNTELSASGILKLGPISLDLVYINAITAWRFYALLGTDHTDTDVYLIDALGSLWADVKNVLPDFLTEHIFTIPDQTNRAATAPSPIKVTCAKFQGSMILSVIVKALGFEFSYTQITPASPPNGTPVQTPKRMLRFEMGSLPAVSKDIPLLDSLTQPFDQLDFIYITDDFTKAEVALLNTEIFTDPNEQLICKPPVQVSIDISKQPNDTVLAKGCHFMIIVDQNNTPTAVLDYCFGAPPAIPEAPISPLAPKQKTSRDDSGPPVTPPTSGAQAPWSKTLGPLTISAIGLKYENKKVQLTLNATVAFAGIEIDLKGFGIRFPLNMNNISQFSIDDVDVLLSGMGVYLSRPPLTIAGEMVVDENGYSGGIEIKFEPYTFLAAGAYLKMEDYKSILLMLSVQGPIATLELASLYGLMGGYGYNSEMRMPSVAEVTSHPFLAPAAVQDLETKKGSILDTFSTLIKPPAPWFTPSKGPQWIAAGIGVDAMSTLNMEVVVVVDLSADVILALFADCNAQIPASATSAANAFASIEIGILAILDYAKGSLSVQGQLTPTSFVLSQKCHLRGGFALCYWFAGSGHDGDWVMTIGGYHPSYKPPDWYPVPPRLGITWQYDDTISIIGDAYFAITPKVCMGGGKLALSYLDGTLSANLTAWADFLINYQPFYFTAEIGVNVDVNYKFDHWGITKQFNVNFGCTLDLWGPPVAGTIHIETWIISFDVHFGNKTQPLEALKWEEFKGLLLQSNTAKSDHASLLDINAVDGIVDPVETYPLPVPKPKPDPPTFWTVDGTSFKIRLTSLFPIREVHDLAAKSLYTSTSDPVYMKPMHFPKDDQHKTLMSTLTISITDHDGNDQSDRFVVEPVIKQVPLAIWGQYDANTDPSISEPSSTLLDPADATTAQLMGFNLGPANPTISNDFFEVDVVNDASAATLVPSPSMPSPLSIPATLPDANGISRPFQSTVNPSMSQADFYSRQTALWKPDQEMDAETTKIRLQQYTMKQAVRYPDLIRSWKAMKDIEWNDKMGEGPGYEGLFNVGLPATVLGDYMTDDSIPLPRVGQGLFVGVEV